MASNTLTIRKRTYLQKKLSFVLHASFRSYCVLLRMFSGIITLDFTHSNHTNIIKANKVSSMIVRMYVYSFTQQLQYQFDCKWTLDNIGKFLSMKNQGSRVICEILKFTRAKPWAFASK